MKQTMPSFPPLKNKQILLLREIALTGSIAQAAQHVGISYKTAWDAVDGLNNLFPQPLIVGRMGGKNGGGTQLTPYGEQVLLMFESVEHQYRVFLDAVGVDASSTAPQLPDTFGIFLKGLLMKTSARNQFIGQVTEVKQGAVNSEVHLNIGGQQNIIATITNDSVMHLELQKGKPAHALIKASAVQLAVNITPSQVSAENCLLGEVEDFTAGAVNCEVKVRLVSGKQMVAIITNESAMRLALGMGQTIYVLFSASSVILATES